MANGDIVMVGLPSTGLQALAGGLEFPHVENEEIRAAYDNLDEARDVTPEWMMERLAGHFEGGRQAGALLVYQAPWKFLERKLANAGAVPGNRTQLEWFTMNALGFWHAYHAALLALSQQHEGRCLLLNGDRAVKLDAVCALLEERFGPEAGAKRKSPAPAARGAASGNEEAYWQVTERVAPQCLEMYATLEACAELMGRQPEFGTGRYPRREGDLAELLRAELKALSPEGKAGLYLLQLTQVQEELESAFELNWRKDGQIAEMRRQLEWQSTPPIRKLARKALGLGKSAARLIASSRVGRWASHAGRKWALKSQAESIRASGLFDEQWYLQTYPDVAQARIDPVEHYLRFGASDGRNPSAQFNTRWYRDAYSDVAATGMNPLLHYIEFGRREGRRPVKRRPPVTASP